LNIYFSTIIWIFICIFVHWQLTMETFLPLQFWFDCYLTLLYYSLFMWNCLVLSNNVFKCHCYVLNMIICSWKQVSILAIMITIIIISLWFCFWHRMPFCCYGSCSRKLPYGTFHYNQSTIDSHRLIQEFKSKLYKSITHRPIETNICTTTHSTDNTNFVSIPTIQNSHPHVDEQIQDQFMVKSTYFIDDLHINTSTNALPQISPIIEHLLQIKHRHNWKLQQWIQYVVYYRILILTVHQIGSK
jgi:hypothetical protein